MDWLGPSQQDLVRIAARVAGSLLTVALLVWFFRRAQRRPARRRDHSDMRILEYGPALRWLFPVPAIGFGILYVVTTGINPAEIQDPGGRLFWPTVLIEAIALVGFLETWVVKIELSEYGIVSRSPWTGTRQVAWGQIESPSHGVEERDRGDDGQQRDRVDEVGPSRSERLLRRCTEPEKATQLIARVADV